MSFAEVHVETLGLPVGFKDVAGHVFWTGDDPPCNHGAIDCASRERGLDDSELIATTPEKAT